MGIPFSCSYDGLDELDRRFEAFLVRSMSSLSNDEGSTLRSLSFNGRDSEPATMKSFGSGKMLLKGSLSFKGRELENLISFRPPEETIMVRTPTHMSRETGEPLPTDSASPKATRGPLWESGYKRFQAALRLQKVYKSFRTRRQLADCAVLVEQRWWKLLDFAELKRSSISFFDIENPETVFSRWSRARTRAAKVGKGLSKDERARKLALQHWLEAIDPRHRYGHNLQFYYCKWLHCESKQPFFYWLDIGEGKEVNLERCPRPKLLQQCIKYLGPKERREYEVSIDDGKFFYKPTGKLLDTREGPLDAKWIFVLSVSKNLYVGQKHKGTFQHSSFLAGGATLSAGRLVVEDGILKAVWPHSGHYLPTEENFEEFMSFLKDHEVDLSIVQRSPTDEEEGGLSKKRSELTIDSVMEEVEKVDPTTEDSDIAGTKHLPFSRNPKISTLRIPIKVEVIEMLEEKKQQDNYAETPIRGYETADDELSDEEFEVSKLNLFDEDSDSDYEEAVPQEKIMQRINSHKGMKSYQLAQMLSCKWTTGAGPRIGCVRDYPTELQNRALEEVNLSPRSSTPRRLARPSPLALTPTSLCRESTFSSRSPLASAEEKVSLQQIATP